MQRNLFILLTASDYCIGDKNKKNDVITFVIYPYILNFDDLQMVIC